MFGLDLIIGNIDYQSEPILKLSKYFFPTSDLMVSDLKNRFSHNDLILQVIKNFLQFLRLVKQET